MSQPLTAVPAARVLKMLDDERALYAQAHSALKDARSGDEGALAARRADALDGRLGHTLSADHR
jgi:hypothetical protein